MLVYYYNNPLYLTGLSSLNITHLYDTFVNVGIEFGIIVNRVFTERKQWISVLSVVARHHVGRQNRVKIVHVVLHKLITSG